MEELRKAPASFHSQLGNGAVTRQAAVLRCIIASVAANGDYVTVYNGKDATSGSKIVKLVVLANASVSFNISEGVRCDNGIYVACSVGTVDWSVFYHDIPPEKKT